MFGLGFQRYAAGHALPSALGQYAGPCGFEAVVSGVLALGSARWRNSHHSAAGADERSRDCRTDLPLEFFLNGNAVRHEEPRGHPELVPLPHDEKRHILSHSFATAVSFYTPSQPAPNGLFVWLIFPNDRLALTTSAAMVRRDFLPLRTHSHSSRDKKVPLTPSFADLVPPQRVPRRLSRRTESPASGRGHDPHLPRSGRRRDAGARRGRAVNRGLAAGHSRAGVSNAR